MRNGNCIQCWFFLSWSLLLWIPLSTLLDSPPLLQASASCQITAGKTEYRSLNKILLEPELVQMKPPSHSLVSTAPTLQNTATGALFLPWGCGDRQGQEWHNMLLTRYFSHSHMLRTIRDIMQFVGRYYFLSSYIVDVHFGSHSGYWCRRWISISKTDPDIQSWRGCAGSWNAGSHPNTCIVPCCFKQRDLTWSLTSMDKKGTVKFELLFCSCFLHGIDCNPRPS